MRYTPEQLDFIKQIEEGSTGIRLDAVAGSGKTTTLLAAAQHISPSQTTIALAFNKKIQEVLEQRFPKHIHCKTFNGLGHTILGRRFGRPKLNARKMGELTSDRVNNSAMSEKWYEIRDLACQMKSAGLCHPDFEDKLKCETKIADYNSIQELALHYDLTIDDDIIDAAMDVLSMSMVAASTGEIDFDDQIYITTYFTADKYWPKYQNILVDESQDLSYMQHDMVERLMESEVSRLIIVGDPNQAIYGWRGAASSSMNDLEERFKLKRMPLSVCFRCPSQVVTLAQAIVPQIQPKENADPGVIERKGIDWKSTDLEEGSVVLCRNNAPLIALAFDLLRNNRPAYFSGRDIGAGLKKALKQVGEGLLGAALLNWMNENVDKAKAKGHYDKADMIEDTYEVLECIRVSCEARTKNDLIKGIEYLFRVEYSPDVIELSTIHRSKGKEWETVYFLNENLIPGRWILDAYMEGKPSATWMMEQENNLHYVAVTRSLNKLIFIERGKNVVREAS